MTTFPLHVSARALRGALITLVALVCCVVLGAGPALASSSDSASPSSGVTVESTPGTDASEAADSGQGDGAPVWIFYVVVVVAAAGGLAVVQLRRRRRTRRH